MDSVETGATGRGPDGRFLAGNQAAASHKRRQRMAMLRCAFTEAVTPEAIAEIVNTLVRQAKGGCPQSAKLVLDRALGKPSILDSEDPPDAEERPLTRAELGPVTPENMELHRAIILRDLKARTGAV